MKFTRVIAAGFVLTCLGLTSAQAQSRGGTNAPAEFPPASFTGNQYVDSRGCVFIRAGIDGNVTWVPRVNRSRSQVCGARPTLGRTATATATAQPTPRAVQITPQPAPQRVVRAPQTAPRSAAPRRQPIPTIATTTKPPKQVIRRAPAPVVKRVPAPAAPQPVVRTRPKPATTTIQRTTRCPGASALSNRYINDGSRYPVRCGPQSERPVTLPGESHSSVAAQRDYQIAQADTLRSGTRVVPKHVYLKRQNTRNVQVPHGYRTVWEDDRLNPYRAEQTLQGHAQTQQIWTNRVPRTLANPTRRLRTKQPKVHAPAELGLRRQAPVVSSKQQRVSQKAAAPKAAQTGSRYVQVGLFGVEANARTTAQRMSHAGLPVRVSTLTRGGKSYRMVMAGPFSSNAQAQTALNTVRRAGFSDAYIRK